MTDVLSAGMPSDVDLIRGLSVEEDRGLLALSVPEAVTDAVADRLLIECGIRDSSSFITLVRSCDFVVQRNDEWRLSDDAKAYLLPLCRAEGELWTTINATLARVADDADKELALPFYLQDPAGHAYHVAALDPVAGLSLYADIAVLSEIDSNDSTTWLASRLAHEQRSIGILPPDSSELDFLTAMSLYNDGRRAEAIRQLRPLTEAKGDSMPIAVACHLVGRWDGDTRSSVHYRIAEKLLRRSIRIGQELQRQRHVAQAQHSLALILLINAGRDGQAEAFELLDRSLATLLVEKDAFGVAKVLHTYGQALSRIPTERDRARTMLLQSLRIGRSLGKERHQAGVLESLARLLEGSNAGLAKRAAQIAERLERETGPIREPARGTKGSGSGRGRR